MAALVLEYGGDEEAAIAALLHDAVEDAGGEPRLADIRLRFGEAAADIVDGCSDSTTIPKPPWRERKEEYVEHLESAPPATLLVSCCDKLHNARCIVADLRDLGDDLWSRFKGGKDGTLWYYETMAAAFERLEVPACLSGELRRTVDIIHDLAHP